MSRRAPRPLSAALGELTSNLAPATMLASVQEAWPRAAGPAIAAVARPVGERDGVLEVLCEAAVWAAEIELLGGQIVAALNELLGPGTISALRCRTG